uniref:Movement protein n=1 Tax=Andean potato mild mosaic virus TaxID=1296569 RepID=A0A8F8N2L6_9VIRU|nr:movement protein [Andean potato mild mosaic virus]
MNHVFPDCPRSSQFNYSSRCFYKSNSQCRRGTSPRLSIPISLAAPKRVSATPSLLGHPELWSRHHPSPSPYSQNSRNIHAVQSLALSCQNPFHCHVHEAQQVFKTPAPEQQLYHSHQLPLDCRGHHQVPRDFSLVPYHRVLLHARRADVLLSSADIDSLLREPQSSDSLLLSCGSPRVSLHRPLSTSRSLLLPDFRKHSPLHSGVPPLRSLQPASSSPVLAKGGFHFSLFTPALSHEAGILGPRPLHPDPERTASKTFPQSPPKSCPNSPPLQPQQQPSPVHRSSLQQFGTSRQPGFLPDSRLPRVAFRHVSEPTSPPSAHSNRSVQCSLHLHKSRSDSPNFRPSRVCPNTEQQGRVLLGYPKCLGQSPDLRSAEFSPSTVSKLPILPEPVQTTPIALLSALENVLVGSLAIPLIFSPSSPGDEFEFPNSNSKATFSFPSPSSISLHFDCTSLQHGAFPTAALSPLPGKVSPVGCFPPPKKPSSKASTCSKDRVETPISRQLHSKAQHRSPNYFDRPSEHPSSPEILPLSYPSTASRPISSESSSSEVPALLVSSGTPCVQSGALSPVSSSSYSSCGSLSSYSSPPRFPENQPRVAPTESTPRISASELRSRLLELHLKYPFIDEDC